MKTKLMILGGCACLLLAGCASPQGGATADTNEGYTTNYDEDVYSGQMNAPTMRSGLNTRDMRDPQAVTPRPGPESRP